MLLMEHCNDIDQGNPCARSREGSWHGTSDEAGTTRRSVGWSKQSPVGIAISDSTALNSSSKALLRQSNIYQN